jgi:hypothetical protein
MDKLIGFINLLNNDLVKRPILIGFSILLFFGALFSMFYLIFVTIKNRKNKDFFIN